MLRADAILETVVYCHDLDAAERFYTSVLRLEKIASQPGRHVFFRCGDGVFLVFNPEATWTATVLDGGIHVPRHGAIGQGHMAFAMCEKDAPLWRSQLERAGVAIEAEVEWPGGARSLYFRDPEGNSIELATPNLWFSTQQSEA